MAVDTDFASLLNSLKVEDPWLPPRPWESKPTESGLSVTSTSLSSPSSSKRFYDTSTVSEASLVRLAMNALQGLESSLTSIDKLCTIFRSDPTDRTFHRTPSLWNQSVSTLALEKILRSLGCMGCEVFLLHKFINHFTNLNWDATLRSNKKAESELEESKRYYDEAWSDYPPYSLVNQAFAAAVEKVLEGYVAALDTLSSSVDLRRLSNSDNMSCTSTLGIGCLSSVGHSEVTLLEVYLHTKELRSQIEVIGSICNVHNLALCFSLSPLGDLLTQTKFRNFPRGGNLLTYLYMELKVADPVHCALLKTLFIRSCEPYFDFIRSWIFKAKITDPFNEFIVAEAGSQQSYSLSNTGVLVDFPSATIRKQDGVSVPRFLKDILIPLYRAGQQLQVLIKLLEFSDGVGSWNRTYEDFLPYWSRLSSSHLSHASHLAFSKEGIEMMVLARREYYKIMMEKLKNHLPKLEFKYQVIPHSMLPAPVSNGRGSMKVPPLATNKNMNQNLPLCTVDCDASSMAEELEDPLDSYECSSIENSGEEDVDESEKMVEFFHDSEDLDKKYLSVLEFNSDTSSNILINKPSQGISPSARGSGSQELSKNADLPGYSLHHQHSWMNMNSVPLELDWNLSCMMEAQFPDGSIAKNPISNDIGNIDDTWLNASSYKRKNDLSSGGQEKNTSHCRDVIPICSDLAKEFANKCQHPYGDALSLRSLRSWKVECANLILGTSKLRERCSKVYLPSFDFRSVRDPFTECVDRFGSSNRGDQFMVSANSSTMRNHHNKGNGGDTLNAEKNLLYTPLGLEIDHQEQSLLHNVSGGGCWELLLDGSINTNDIPPGEHKTSVAAVIEIPLDFVLEKCLLEEIQLQYIYVSKLTIKLLEEGFSLQEHLLALRRYHMMESADWADLFIVSLRHHKWNVTEADKRISEIQGLLELSVQRSSCERDHYKDRLFVYMKDQGSTSLPAFATGIQSFNVLGLGYRVDWPVSIVLTPDALKIYAQIFSFLIQVKLALSSLTEVWCSFKEFIHVTNQGHYSDLRKSEACHFNIMVKLRHQIFHFVSTTLNLASSLSVDVKDDYLISPDGVFTAGFYSVGENAFCFSIWLTKPLSNGVLTVVWMANRDTPVNGERSKLSLLKTGNLVLQDADQDLPIWTTRTRDLTGSAQLKMNNSGNLYLQSRDGQILWQSFGSPTDTLLPNQPLTKDAMLVSSRSRTNYSSGFYKLIFDNDNVLRLVYSGPKVTGIYWPNPELRAWDAGRSTYGSERTATIDRFGRFISSDGLFFNTSDDGDHPMRRVTMDFDGNVRVYSLDESRRIWQVTWQAIAQTCTIHGSCGENSTCSNEPTYGRKCTCLPYHKMVNQTDWSYGCEPEFEQSLCGNGEDGFRRLPHFDFYGYDSKYLPNITLDACKQECMDSCNCKGFQYKYDKKQGIFLCYPKFLLLNGFGSVSFNGSLYLKVPTSILSSNTNIAMQELNLNCSGHPTTVQLERVYDKKKEKGSIKFLLLFTYVFGALEMICIIYFFYKTRNSIRNSQGYLQAATGFQRFSYADLRKASENFSLEIGRGGGAVVYKGVLSDNRVAAIKCLKEASSDQGEAEFLAEISTLGRLNHMNLIDMWGYCAEGKHRILVYEYMENGSLAENLHSNKLDWDKRFEVALGTAKGLAYLHEECLEWVLHCDVKPHNILLDHDYLPKVADFGLSKFLDRDGRGNLEFTKARGTRGYMAPEWFFASLPITSKVDVYSYGVVMLEMITGRSLRGSDQSDGYETMTVRWVREKVAAAAEGYGGNSNWIEEIVDSTVNGEYDRIRMGILIKVALQCAEDDKDARPTMSQVVDMLLRGDE